MKTYQTVIIDDEYAGRLMIRQLASAYSILSIAGEADSGHEAIRMINETKPDLIFLDIELRDMNGFDVLAAVSHQPLVIFTTAYDQFALDAFRGNTLDYLLKPIDRDRFDHMIKKLETSRQFFSGDLISLMQEAFHHNQPKKKLSAIPIHQGDRITLLKTDNICYISSENGYTALFDKEGKKQLTDRSLSDLEESLPENFLRIQKSYVINKDLVKEIHRHFNSRFLFTMQDGKESRLLSGKSYATIIRDAFNL